jgi:succinylglutamate desuccinylase
MPPHCAATQLGYSAAMSDERSNDLDPEPTQAITASTAADCASPQAMPHFAVSIPTPDISPWLDGNTGIPGFTTRNSNRPGPHVVLTSLTHGNEIAGAIVLNEMLRAGAIPEIGKLTFGFANLAAFARFDAGNPIASRFVEEDLNRCWDDIQLFGVRRSLELDRAREIRPLIDTADIVLDLHSMLWPSDPLLLCGPAKQGRDLALAIGTPAMVVADQGHAGGKRLIDYARFTEPACVAACILVEAGQHWETATLTQMRATISALLHYTGQIPAAPRLAPKPPSYAEVTHTITARTNRFVFERNFRGGERIPYANTLIAHDGDTEIYTPYDNCLLIMPSHKPSNGHTAIRLAKEAVLF